MKNLSNMTNLEDLPGMKNLSNIKCALKGNPANNTNLPAMLKNKPSIQYVTIKNGLFTFLGLVSFFLLMKMAGLAHIVELRCLNFPIMVTGIWLALHRYKKSHNKAPSPVHTLALGIKTTIIAMVLFAFFIFIYLKFDPTLLEHIRTRILFGYHLNHRSLALLVAGEGLLSGFFISYTLRQYVIIGQLTMDDGQLKGKS